MRRTVKSDSLEALRRKRLASEAASMERWASQGIFVGIRERKVISERNHDHNVSVQCKDRIRRTLLAADAASPSPPAGSRNSLRKHRSNSNSPQVEALREARVVRAPAELREAVVPLSTALPAPRHTSIKAPLPAASFEPEPPEAAETSTAAHHDEKNDCMTVVSAVVSTSGDVSTAAHTVNQPLSQPAQPSTIVANLWLKQAARNLRAQLDAPEAADSLAAAMQIVSDCSVDQQQRIASCDQAKALIHELQLTMVGDNGQLEEPDGAVADPSALVPPAEFSSDLSGDLTTTVNVLTAHKSRLWIQLVARRIRAEPDAAAVAHELASAMDLILDDTANEIQKVSGLNAAYKLFQELRPQLGCWDSELAQWLEQNGTELELTLKGQLQLIQQAQREGVTDRYAVFG